MDLMKKAREIIKEARGQQHSVEERRVKAIDLAALMVKEARRIQTRAESHTQEQIAQLMDDEKGKTFLTSMTDQCFRSLNPRRIASQMIHLTKRFGVPSFLDFTKKIRLTLFKTLGVFFGSLLVPAAKRMVRKETSKVMIPAEKRPLYKHIKRRYKEGTRVNLNHLGEAVLGEEEAEHRLKVYIEDLERPEIEYVSVKVSTIFSQINLLAWEESITVLSERLRQLYRAAKTREFTRRDGTRVPKIVNLDMEEYSDLHLTMELFCRVLDEPEFYDQFAGIVLQSYLPDSYLIQQKLTVWAMQRVAKGGAPIKIRIVKGANLAMEQVESSLQTWPQAPYTKKCDVDANYKRMLTYACEPDHARAAHVGVGSHNLFDVAYALLLRAENNVEEFVSFEMLEGMVEHMNRVVKELSGEILLYCPAVTEREFPNGVAYLMRRLDENTAPENFLRHVFNLIPGTEDWQTQVQYFSAACHHIESIHSAPRRTQNRLLEPVKPALCYSFQNEPDTDWSLRDNQKWAAGIVDSWKEKSFETIPLVIANETIVTENQGKGRDPSRPGKELYKYSLADKEQIDKAVTFASNHVLKWSQVSVQERTEILEEVAQHFRRKRGDLIGAMIADGGKTIPQADGEVSEAIDFIEYYRKSLLEITAMEDVRWHAKGVALVTPPWNFPCAIPVGGIVSSLAAGNCVIFKPARETMLVGWTIANLFWEAGISKEVLQFMTCREGTALIRDPRVDYVVLTGSTETAKFFLNERPGIDLLAETGGKNSIIVTAMADRDMAVHDAVHSAFGHTGQKCSACSLLICEDEVYYDPNFRKQLRDAAKSLPVGPAWDLKTSVNPLIREASEELQRGLTQLDAGEEWLLEPKQDPDNPNLWSPGIKLGVKPGSFTHQTELFGPVLGVMRAKNLNQAIQYANGTRYGLTSGLQSLDDREQKIWLEKIEAGNCYINRGITGAIVQRQPFGGCKESSYGFGSKVGGPNYLMQMMVPDQVALPKEQELFENDFSFEDQLWKASIGSYTYYWKHYFSQEHDPSRLLGQDNILCYRPRKSMTLRVQENDTLLDVCRIIAACQICGTPLDVSGEKQLPNVKMRVETEAAFIERLPKITRLRLISEPSPELQKAAALCNVHQGEVFANGRIELLHYLREVSISNDYHRYGNLGDRESETRAPLPESLSNQECFV